MRDQAERLRQIVKKLKEQRLSKENEGARVITVTSGKGGVGKTSITVNLAIVLSEMGFKTLVIDADFALANIDVMLGIIPKYDLSHVILNKKTLAEIIADGPGGIRFISGGSGVRELINLDTRQLEGFIKEVSELDKMADVILIDTGAGLSEKVLKMVLAANEVILVTTPEPTAITDAYALTKTIISSNREVNLKLLVNKAQNGKEGQEVLDKFENVVMRFLGMKVTKLGYLLADPVVSRAVMQQEPFVLSYPKSPISKQLRSIAKIILSTNEVDINKKSGLELYIRRLAGFLNFQHMRSKGCL